MSEIRLSQAELDYLLSPVAIRDRAKAIYSRANEGKGFFQIHEERFEPLVSFVMETIAKNYPLGNIPFHSRWGHFRAGGRDRVVDFKKEIAHLDVLERARTEIDLVVTSVLLDAGAGAAWSYKEPGTGITTTRSEGLGVASLHMFRSGIMSDSKKELRAEASGLRSLKPEDLEQHFQVSAANPLVGVHGRLGLLNSLAGAVENRNIFSTARPGALIDYLKMRHGMKIPAPAILRAVLDGFGPIWPGRLVAVGDFGKVNLGDVWRHSGLDLTSGGGVGGLVPIHKLSQWLTYSLIEPIQDAGFEVSEIEKLTGLAEYRNGGLLVDRDLISLRDPKGLDKKWKPESDLIIEWRALTVYFLDRIGAEVQKNLGRTPSEFPLAKVLEGGTWWAGRFAAKEKRPSADPPIQIESDGTVF
ncbi:MAG: DUF1688 family protein [Bdellovibrionales bacterium]|nr:DUF1688 family protein [Bdellovibrionales bacterium]